MSELRQYDDSELVELGISRYDIEEVARGGDAAAENCPLIVLVAQKLRRAK
jgi:hypothetical protein